MLTNSPYEVSCWGVLLGRPGNYDALGVRDAGSNRYHYSHHLRQRRRRGVVDHRLVGVGDIQEHEDEGEETGTGTQRLPSPNEREGKGHPRGIDEDTRRPAKSETAGAEAGGRELSVRELSVRRKRWGRASCPCGADSECIDAGSAGA